MAGFQAGMHRACGWLHLRDAFVCTHAETSSSSKMCLSSRWQSEVEQKFKYQETCQVYG